MSGVVKKASARLAAAYAVPGPPHAAGERALSPEVLDASRFERGAVAGSLAAKLPPLAPKAAADARASSIARFRLLAAAWTAGAADLSEAPERATFRRLGGRGPQSVFDRVAISADGARLATSQGEKIEVWNAADGERVACFTSPERGRLAGLDFSADGTVLASVHAYGQLALWDVEAGAALAPPRACERGIASVRWSPEGKRLALVRQNGPTTLESRDVAGGRPLPEMPSHHPTRAAFSPDGRTIATISCSQIATFDLDSGAKVIDARFPGWITAFAFGRDGRRLAATHLRADGGADLVLLDLKTGEELARTSASPVAILDLAISRDGRRIATVDGGETLRIHDAKTLRAVGSPLHPREFGQEDVSRVGRELHGGVAFGSDDRTIISSVNESVTTWEWHARGG